MRAKGILVVAAVLAAAGCGRVTDLEPAPGHKMPVKPEMARETPTFEQLLQAPPQARPDRVDELVKRSQPRPDDPFELPPATGGNAPSEPAGAAPGPVTNSSSSTTANPGE
jgi:hypothetical protein